MSDVKDSTPTVILHIKTKLEAHTILQDMLQKSFYNKAAHAKKKVLL